MYQFQDKKQITKKKKIIKLIIYFVVFLGVYVFFEFSNYGQILNYIGVPVWKSQSKAIDNLESLGYLFKTKSSVFNDNQILLKENYDLRLAMVDYNILKDDNLKLKELFDRIPENHNFVISNILTKPSRSPYDSIIIDIGEKNGVKIGDSVYANMNIPIGKIDKVYSNTSLVVLYSNPGQITEGVLSESNATILLIGRGGGNFETTIPIELSFSSGMLVLIPNILTEVIAVAEDVISLPSDPIKKILLRSPVNIQNLKWVEVEIDK